MSRLNEFPPEDAAGRDTLPSTLLRLVAQGRELPRTAIERIQGNLARAEQQLQALETGLSLKNGFAARPGGLSANELRVLWEALAAARQIAATVTVDSLSRSVVSSLDDYLFTSTSQEI